MVIALVILNIFVTLLFMFRYCFDNKGIEINHAFLFGVGLTYYWMLPVIVGELTMFPHSPAMDSWHGYYRSIPNSSKIIFLFFSLAFSISFFLGHFFGKRLTVKNPVSKLVFDHKLLTVMLVGISPLIAYYLLKFRNNFFLFYSSDINVSDEKGPLIFLSVLILAMVFMYNDALEKRLDQPAFLNVIMNKFTIVYFIIALLILTMGGRLYFLSSIVMLLVYHSVYFKRFTKRSIAIFSVISIVCMGFLGVFRLGADSISLESIVFNVAAEPVYTAFSLITFLQNNSIEWLNAPVFLSSQFINIIPSFILENKQAFFISPLERGYIFSQPIGALNSFVSFIINFGMIGSVIVIFFFSFFMNYLKAKTNHILFKVMYIMISGWIPFTFFRDGFSVSIVKQMFQLSFLFPMMIIVVVLLISNVPSVVRKRKTFLEYNQIAQSQTKEV